VIVVAVCPTAQAQSSVLIHNCVNARIGIVEQRRCTAHASPILHLSLTNISFITLRERHKHFGQLHLFKHETFPFGESRPSRSVI
jgi:hypothetical protein